jgi:hypothetical protein
LRDRLQNVAGPGDVGQIELRLDLRFRSGAGRALLRGRGGLVLFGEKFADPYGLILFDGTRMGLLLGDADLGKDVKDRL